MCCKTRLKEAGKRVLVGFLELDEVLYKAHSFLQLPSLPNHLHSAVQIYHVGASEFMQCQHPAIKCRLDIGCRDCFVSVVTWEPIGKQLDFSCCETFGSTCSLLHSFLVNMFILWPFSVSKEDALESSGVHMRLVLADVRLIVPTHRGCQTHRSETIYAG